MVGMYVDQDHRLLLDVKPDPGAVGELVLSPAVDRSFVGDELEVTLHAMASGVVRERAGGEAFPCRDHRVALYGEDINPPFAGIGCSENDLVLAAAQRPGNRLLLRAHFSARGSSTASDSSSQSSSVSGV